MKEQDEDEETSLKTKLLKLFLPFVSTHFYGRVLVSFKNFEIFCYVQKWFLIVNKKDYQLSSNIALI